MPPTSVGDISQNFSRFLSDLRDNAGKQVAALQGAQRRWFIPDDIASLTATDLNIQGYFDRSDLNRKYEQILTSRDRGVGRVSDLLQIRPQIAYLAAGGRAFAARHASPARAMVVGHAARRGHNEGALWSERSGMARVLARYSESAE